MRVTALKHSSRPSAPGCEGTHDDWVWLVRYWIAGERGPGGFPEPIVERQRGSEWSWAEVAAWLSAARIGRVDHIAAETARVCVLVDSALAVRRGIRELPKRDRPLITDLVA